MWDSMTKEGCECKLVEIICYAIFIGFGIFGIGLIYILINNFKGVI
jgi:hypothetical protein